MEVQYLEPYHLPFTNLCQNLLTLMKAFYRSVQSFPSGTGSPSRAMMRRALVVGQGPGRSR